MTTAPLQSDGTAAGDDARRQLLGRIVGSRAFARSARLREFLQFVGEKSLEGEAHAVTELEIAHRIFGRGEDFIPADDSVVRVSARQLRAKLKDYFDGEGRHEPVIIEIPKGAYLPVFSVRHSEAAPSLPDADHPPGGWRSLHRAWKLGIGAVVLANVALLVVNLWWMKRPAADASAAAPSLLTFFLSGAKAPVHVVVSDFSLPLMRFDSADGGTYNLDSYLGWDYSSLRPDASASPRLRGLFEILRTHRITRLGDLTVALSIQRAAAAARVPILVRHARDVSLRDFKSGRHIVLGNPYSTPWVSLFEDRLNFYNVRTPHEGVGFANRRPLPGEPAVYRVLHADREEGLGYARLAFVPNTSGDDGVLLIGGVNMVTMEAAGEFVTDPAVVPRILQALDVPSLDRLPHFELMLETQAVDNTPEKARILASRVFH